MGIAGNHEEVVIECILAVQLLHGFKGEVGEANWREFADQFPPALKEKLSSTYQL